MAMNDSRHSPRRAATSVITRCSREGKRRMRKQALGVLGIAIFCWATVQPTSAQQGGTTPSVQVGVPQGRPGGAGAPGGGRRGRGPSLPAPRGPNGRVLLQGRTPDQKGVWLPEGVVTTSFA